MEETVGVDRFHGGLRRSIRIQNKRPTSTFSNTADDPIYVDTESDDSSDTPVVQSRRRRTVRIPVQQTDPTMQERNNASYYKHAGSDRSEAQMSEAGRNNVNTDSATRKTKTKSGGCSKDAEGFSSNSDSRNLHQTLEDTNDGNNNNKKKSSTTTGPTRAYVCDTRAMAATPADVIEYPNSYIFIVDILGLKSSDIKVQVEADVLVVSGERKREHEQNAKEGVKYVRMERVIGKFVRKFALPENANVEKISAVCEDGVLTITVEKLPPPEPIQVPVA
ncbi:hypothetical protein OSB04_014649 [Centaurea solstitialis]|uniref:SHSP domain-containing protein n=1 Tax=Centaurea solstitialis TaxID=347529 RepID=A0AA38SXH5_9ASTR|nr:hypothetical protein OSB04_014649 [Centaurea solstitialis]